MKVVPSHSLPQIRTRVFTLIELLVVITIMLVIMAILLPALDGRSTWRK